MRKDGNRNRVDEADGWSEEEGCKNRGKPVGELELEGPTGEGRSEQVEGEERGIVGRVRCGRNRIQKDEEEKEERAMRDEWETGEIGRAHV